MALDLSAFSQATPAGAIGGVLSAAASTPVGATAHGAPATSGPKTINISGFGGRSSGSATQSLTQPEPDRGQFFPSSPSSGVPSWLLPVAVAVLLVGVVVRFAGRA